MFALFGKSTQSSGLMHDHANEMAEQNEPIAKPT